MMLLVNEKKVKSRKVIFKDGTSCVIGLGLGRGEFEEHNFSSLEEGVDLVKSLNSVPDGIHSLLGIPLEDYKSLQKKSKEDFKFIKGTVKQNIGKSDYPMYANFIIRPNVGLYTRKIIIDNSTYKGEPALEDGSYNLLCIEGICNYGFAKDFFNKKLEGRRKFNESELFFSPDYEDSYVSTGKFMSSYSKDSPNLWLILKNESPYNILFEIIQTKLSNGYLALIPNAFGKYPGLNLIFLDRFCFGRDLC